MPSATPPPPNNSGRQLNALLPQFEKLMAPEYVAAYNANIVGKVLAHQRSIAENRSDPVIVGFGYEPGPEVGSIDDIKIPVSGDEQIVLKVYRPQAKPNLVRPRQFTSISTVEVYRTPSDPRAGDDDAWIRTMVARTGTVIVDVDYRSSPEYRFPIPMEDCWEAFEWVRANTTLLGVDPNRISLGGFSAGGHIAAFISQRARDRGVKGICFCLMVVPVTDASSVGVDLEPASNTPHTSWITNYDAPFLSHARMSYFYRHFLPEDFTAETLKKPELSPLLHSNFMGLPPTLVVTAEIDVLRSEGVAYAKRLQEEGDGWVHQWTAMGVPHAFPRQTAITPRAREFYELSAETMKDAFAGNLT